MRLRPGTGTAFTLDAGPAADGDRSRRACRSPTCSPYNRADVREVHQSPVGPSTMPAAIRLTTGHTLFSNRSNAMLDIVEDDVGIPRLPAHALFDSDLRPFLPRPSAPPRLLRQSGRGAGTLWRQRGHDPDRLQLLHECAGRWRERANSQVLPPVSKAGRPIVFEAKMDLSSGSLPAPRPASNGGSFKPIHWQVD